MVGAGIDASKPFLALHLSGGTTEILLCDHGELTLLGGSLDLHAGQLVDRTGVYMHLPFPAGPSLEKLAIAGHQAGAAKALIGVSVKGIDCCLAGAENKIVKWIESGDMSREEIAQAMAFTIFMNSGAALTYTARVFDVIDALPQS